MRLGAELRLSVVGLTLLWTKLVAISVALMVTTQSMIY